MSTMSSQIPSFTIVYSTVYSGADQRTHQSSASLAFVRGIHRWPVNSPHKGPVTRKMFLFDDVIISHQSCITTFSFQLCRLCQHRYSFIGHLEDLESERQLLLPLAFHDLNTSIPEVHRKKLSDDDKDLRDAYIQIPKEHMEALLTYYEVDFEFFGYSKQIPE